MDKHSKWPIFMRMHGSVTPKMILPIVLVGAWATAITCIDQFHKHSECLFFFTETFRSPGCTRLDWLTMPDWAKQLVSTTFFSLFLVSWSVWHCRSAVPLRTKGRIFFLSIEDRMKEKANGLVQPQMGRWSQVLGSTHPNLSQSFPHNLGQHRRT
jgi:hypothetical protein